MSRTYDLVHRTTYSYANVVTDSYGRTTMTPRTIGLLAKPFPTTPPHPVHV